MHLFYRPPLNESRITLFGTSAKGVLLSLQHSKTFAILCVGVETAIGALLFCFDVSFMAGNNFSFSTIYAPLASAWLQGMIIACKNWGPCLRYKARAHPPAQLFWAKWVLTKINYLLLKSIRQWQ